MKRALFIAGWAVLAAGPVRADLVGALNPMTPRNDLQHLNPNGGGTVGVLTTGGRLYTSYTQQYGSPNVITLNLYPNISDYITVTFAIHWPYATPVLVSRMRHGLNWDTNEVVLVGAGPAGPFTANNIGTTPAAGAALLNSIVGVTGASSGIGDAGIVGIEELAAPGASFVIFGTSVVPFARFTFHVKDPFGSDDLVDIIMPLPGTIGGISPPTPGQGVGLIFSFFTTSMVHSSLSSSVTNINPTSGLFVNFGSSAPSAGVAIKPEPASAALLGIGALALTGGFRRRRRRSHDQSGWPRSYATWGRDFSSE